MPHVLLLHFRGQRPMDRLRRPAGHPVYCNEH